MPLKQKFTEAPVTSKHTQKAMTSFKTLSTNVAVLQFRWKDIPHRWCGWEYYRPRAQDNPRNMVQPSSRLQNRSTETTIMSFNTNEHTNTSSDLLKVKFEHHSGSMFNDIDYLHIPLQSYTHDTFVAKCSLSLMQQEWCDLDTQLLQCWYSVEFRLNALLAWNQKVNCTIGGLA